MIIIIIIFTIVIAITDWVRKNTRHIKFLRRLSYFGYVMTYVMTRWWYFILSCVPALLSWNLYFKINVSCKLILCFSLRYRHLVILSEHPGYKEAKFAHLKTKTCRPQIRHRFTIDIVKHVKQNSSFPPLFLAIST